jgi:ABC-type thiamin/hydroxymethylpyrimidine transport system permease subunit
MKTKSKKALRTLQLMTICYTFAAACYGFIFMSEENSKSLLYFFIGLTCLLMAVAWLCTLIEYKIEKLREEMLQASDLSKVKD